MSDLYTKLREYRTTKSTELDYKPYHIFSNKVLDLLCRNPPQCVSDLLFIDGIGKKKVEDFGNDLLQICNGYSSPITKIIQEPNKIPDSIQLSDKQKQVIQLCDQGSSIFISGPGGCGKSFLIKLLVDRYKDCRHIQVTALTGVAAELLGCSAKTIHSWSRLGILKGSSDFIIDKITTHKKSIKVWKSIDLLIIDEVSMMSLKLFETLDKIGKKIRNNHQPFGGIQLIFSGDFYQLPPVGDNNDPSTGQFCFESPLWSQTFSNVIILDHIFRQVDPIYLKILRQIRRGGISRKMHDVLSTRILTEETKQSFNLTITPTIIYPLKYLVEKMNKRQMKQLSTESVTYKYNTYTNPEFQKNNKISQNALDIETKNIIGRMNGEESLELKIGAQVMCIANIDMESDLKIVNGSQGTIQDISSSGLPIVKFKNGRIQTMKYYSWMSNDIPGFGIQQIPLILSWAITIHKSQGITLETALIDGGDDIFECGQIYVALSRVKTLDGLFLRRFNPSKIKTNPKVIQYYSTL